MLYNNLTKKSIKPHFFCLFPIYTPLKLTIFNALRAYSRKSQEKTGPFAPSAPLKFIWQSCGRGQKGQKGHIKMGYDNYDYKEPIISE